MMQTKSADVLPYQVERDICTAAEKAGADQVLLFGSRSRDQAQACSDIDLAVRGGDCAQFAALLEERSRLPWTFDLVCLDGTEGPAIAASIRQDGIAIYDRRTYSAAVSRYERQTGVLDRIDWEQAERDEVYRTGVLGTFQLAFELASEALKEVMQRYGLTDPGDTASPRGVLRTASQHGMLENVQLWFGMLNQRNSSVHVYDEEAAQELLVLIRERYVPALKVLAAGLRERLQALAQDADLD